MGQRGKETISLPSVWHCKPLKLKLQFWVFSLSNTAWHFADTQQYLSCGCVALLLHPAGSLTQLFGNFFSLLLCGDKLILLLVQLVLKRTKQALPLNTTECGHLARSLTLWLGCELLGYCLHQTGGSHLILPNLSSCSWHYQEHDRYRDRQTSYTHQVSDGKAATTVISHTQNISPVQQLLRSCGFFPAQVQLFQNTQASTLKGYWNSRVEGKHSSCIKKTSPDHMGLGGLMVAEKVTESRGPDSSNQLPPAQTTALFSEQPSCIRHFYLLSGILFSLSPSHLSLKDE